MMPPPPPPPRSSGTSSPGKQSYSNPSTSVPFPPPPPAAAATAAAATSQQMPPLFSPQASANTQPSYSSHFQSSTSSTVSAATSYSTPTAKHEPYGEVNDSLSWSSSSGVHRRPTDHSNVPNAATPPSFSYGSGTSTSYAIPANHYTRTTSDGGGRLGQKQEGSAAKGNKGTVYAHTAVSLTFLLPTLASIISWHQSHLVIQLFLFVVLFIYAMDMINTRDGTSTSIWIGALVLTIVNGLGLLLQEDDSDTSGSRMLLLLAQLAGEGLFFIALACLSTMQFQWLYKEAPGVAIGLEQCLHAVLPPVSSCILAHHILRQLMDYWGIDWVATVAPHLFAILMAIGMFAMGSCQSSFDSKSIGENESTNPLDVSSFAITNLGARAHSVLLLLVPGTVHILIFYRRIFSRVASFDEVYDLILVWAVPYLLHCAVLLQDECPYVMLNSNLFPKSQVTLRGTLLPIGASLAASLALQQRYLIPLCHQISYLFNGHDLPSTFVVTTYLTVATLATVFAVWTWGRKSTITNELLFGEYHEDVVQLCVSISGLLLGKAFGMPWNLTPLPILAFLGLSIWATTRMLRYLSIFLFVVHAAGVVVFSYRFAALEMTVSLPIPGIELGLIRFGMVCVMASVLIGLVAGFAVRQSGGVGAAILKRVDIPGLLFILYVVLLTILEVTLLKKPLPAHDATLKTTEVVDDVEFVYDHAKAFLTSLMVIGIGAFLYRSKTIGSKTALVVIAVAVGKAVAVLIDGSDADGRNRSDTSQEGMARRLLFRAVVAAVLLIVVGAPRCFLSPIHIKSTARYKRSISDGQPFAAVSQGAQRIVFIYCLLILPLTLAVAIPSVLTPLVKALSVHYGGGAYYKMSPPISEVFGFAGTLWGIASLAMLNHFIPDGGLEKWKKVAALTLLMGLGIAMSAPTVPGWIIGNSQVDNPYASISSLGVRLVNQGRSRTGGWGLLSAGLATLLAITGPLELRERKHPSGRKDNMLLLRLMIFSILFGSGVAWFITIQSMSQAEFTSLVLTSIACMVVSFFGTVTSVLGYHLELENFDEVDQISRVWVGSFFVFGLIASSPQFLVRSDHQHPFGTSGWLATYFAVCCFSTLALAVVLRSRPSKSKASRGLGNLSCVTSWLLAIVVLYGRFGVAGLDHAFDFTTIMGIPASVLGTFLLSPILFALEGEISSERRGRVARLAGTNAKDSKGFMGFTLKKLGPSNRIVPLIFGTVLVFIAASLYAILLRGSFFFGGSIATSHVDVFSNIVGKNGDQLAKMVNKSISRNQALVTSARLAASGLWTSSSIFGPLIHLAGLIATFPSIFMLLSQSWNTSLPSKAHVTLFLPLNIIPLVVCNGIPTIRATALIGIVGGIYQLVTCTRQGQRSHMRI